MTASVASLRELLRQRFPGAVPVVDRTASAVPTGLPVLDGALPGRGFPRGRLSTWAPGVGVTGVLLTACQAAIRQGERAAWIDGASVSTGAVWEGGALLARPANDREAWGCAEELVRSGGFATVVLTGTRLAGPERVRLTRVAREGGAALVVVSEEAFLASVRVRSWIPRGGIRWRRNSLGEPVDVAAVRLRVGVTALGWSREAEVELPVVSDDVRLSLEPALVDRRGAAR